MESCFVVKEKIDTNIVTPECYHFVEGEFDWYEIECSVKSANIKDQYKEELYDVIKKCVESKIPFELFEHIVFTKYGVPLLLVETEKQNNTCLHLELNDYHSKMKIGGLLAFLTSIIGIFLGLYTLFKVNDL